MRDASTRRMMRATLGSLLVLVAAGPARAGGYEHPAHGTAALSRGGAFTARADDPSAIIYNPAGAARLTGTHVWVGGNIIMEQVTYQRRIYPVAGSGSSVKLSPDRYPHDQTLKIPEVRSDDPPFITPLVGITTDLGILRPLNLVLMAGVYGPHVHPNRTFPRRCKPGTDPCEPTDDARATPSPARYDTVSQGVFVVYPTLGVAWRPIRMLSVGAVFQATYASFAFENAIMALNMTQDGQSTEDPAYDVGVKLDSEDVFTPTAVLGVLLEPLPFLAIGASVRVGYTIDFEGEVTTEIPDTLKNPPLTFSVAPDPANISLAVTLPWVVRVGVRYIHRDAQQRERFDVELDFNWESTSQVESFVIDTDLKMVKPLVKAVEGLQQDYMWSDIWSLRLGGTYTVHDLFPDGSLSISAGGLYEASGVDDEYVRLGFTPLDRFAFTLGVGVRWGRYELQLGYAHIFHLQREVAPDGDDARTGQCAATGGAQGCGSKINSMVPMDPEQGTPTNNGVFDVDIDIVTLGVKVSFGQ